MNKDVRARVSVVVPDNQPGGPYRENGHLVVPVRVESVEFNPDCF